MSANPPNDPASANEPETITDLSELSFDFEDATPSGQRPASGSMLSEPDPAELAEELELLDALAGQITGDGPPEFYCKPLGQLLGPMSLAELRVMAESGALAADDLVRYGVNGEWKPAASFSRLAESLHQGSSITAEPVSSAPPSTRRLFLTGYKPTGDSFGEDPPALNASVPAEQSAEKAAAATPENSVTTPRSEAQSGADVAEPPVPSAKSSEADADEESGTVNNSDAKAESVTSSAMNSRRRKPAKKSSAARKAGKKSAGKKKPARKRNDEDDAILNDIFSEVFADDQKTQRPLMPPAASTATDTAPESKESASNKDIDPATKSTENSAAK